MHFILIDKISENLPYNFLEYVGGSKVIPMVYHTVGYTDEMPYLKGLYNVPSPEEFEADLDFILKKYHPLNLEGLIKYKQTNSLPDKKKYFFLSFDDGLRQCSEIIAPILERKGVPATFFINSGFVDNKEFLHRFKVVLISELIKKDKTDLLKQKLEKILDIQFTCRYKAAKHVMNFRYPQIHQLNGIINHLGLDINEKLKVFKPYMSKNDIDGLVKKGFTVGAHSAEHPEYFLLDEQAQLDQSIRSINQIKEWFNPKYAAFAFPFTDDGVKNSFFEKLESNCNMDVTFGCAGIKKHFRQNHIQRIPMDEIPFRAENRLRSEYLHSFLKRLIGKNLIKYQSQK